ncbi:MAG: helix-turn-helix transcriptional regulator [Clostridia bacterium]|nr:helix-turn-helix transcriptional regulator [Clostridia bacterium]
MYGEEIKKIRIEHGYTQSEVAQATGIPQNTISWIEGNKGIANISQCVRLADFYGITLDELVGRESVQTKN